LICSLACLASATAAEAATRTFKTVPADGFWRNPANWQEGVVPVNGDDLVFPATPSNLVVVNTIANLQVRSLSLGGLVEINGQPFSIGAITWKGQGKINVPVTLAADQTWEMTPDTSLLEFTAGVSLNGRTLTFEGVPSAGAVRFTGVVSGSGALIINGGKVDLSGANTYAGQTIVNSSGTTLSIQHADALGIGDGTIANGTLIGPGSTLLAIPSVVIDNEWMRLTGAGTTAFPTVRFLAPMTVTGPVELNGNPILRFPNANGTAYRFGGPVAVHGSLPASLAKLTTQNGVGVFDSTTYTGIVDLNGADLSLLLPEAFHPTTGQTFTIIENPPPISIAGTFTGLPEGASFASRGVTFTISYAGGDGNDVVLTASAIDKQYYLSEGATSEFFSTDILLANPNVTDAPATITFLKSDGTTTVVSQNVPARSRRTVRVNDVAGFENAAFSTIVRSDNALPLVVERTMWWDRTGYGSHTERAVDGPSKTWHFAEGSQGFFFTYVLLANPHHTANSATVQYLIEGGPAVTRTYPLEPDARFTIDAGADPDLAGKSFGLTVTFDQPGIAERAMYFGTSPLWKGGHESLGVTAPATSWFLAEGATGAFFETFVLLANPNAADVTATLRFLPASGQPVTKKKLIPANGRLTVNIEQEDPSLASGAVATAVDAQLPIIVERSQYWPDPAPQWYEAHNSFGVPAAGTKWGLAEGRVGGDNNAQTYILLANPGFLDATVQLTFLRETGALVTKSVTVTASTRFTLPVGGPEVPEITNERFGVLIESNQPIAVERALYWNANGTIWAAGSNATASRLP
jgi:hypothetical protein